MRKCKFYIVLAFVLTSLSGMAQSKGFTQKVERVRDTLYLIQNGERFKVDTEVITVKLKPTEKEPESNYKVINSNRLGFYDIKVPEGVDVEEYVNTLKQTGRFETVEYNSEAKCCFIPDDTYIGNQWYINRIHLNDAWNITKGSQNVKVAIIDSGVEASHSDLGYNVNDGYSQIDTSNGVNFTEVPNAHISPVYFHGTSVAGVLGAKTNNTTGIAGVSGGNHSKGITIIPYCVYNTIPFSSYLVDDAILDAIDKGVKVINISLVFSESTCVNSAIEDAYANNITIVCGSGNDYQSYVRYPASHEKTIAVGATNKNNQRASFSHYGTGLDLVAPGDSIYSTCLNNTYGTFSGTSLATPQVAGVIALMLSINPNLTPSQIKTILINSCTKLSGYTYDNNGWNSEVGYGLLNAFTALFSLLNFEIEGPQLIYNYGQYRINNLPSGVTVTWSVSNNYYNNGTQMISNFPALGWCLIFRDEDHDMINGTLTAEIKYNGVTVQTLTKTIHAYDGFWGQYTSGDLSGEINSSNYFYVRQNATTHITSPNLVGASASYDNTATIPTNWIYNSTNGTLDFYVQTNNPGVPVKIYITDTYGHHHQLYAMPTSNYNMNVSSEDNGITITLNEDGGSERGMDFDQSWTIEVCNATTGALMATRSSTSRSEMISTAGWPKGIYIVKVTIGEEVLTEKVIVR